ncbi:MAG: bifunctional pyr operon transcriptional regulator/uracil phosphoribosyltransferase PyrR [Candidatus Marinimicrobia bacterium]|jgi:pyrimidine operon attenuation protein/uracil phosphoribosyltransferase|nr:bifunctional pyr operon transcriptional regulator/uracil phosphoribosyltransferase PyrR [Candidatus Neomarinimicrobiota bacterium]MBT3618670.1 bifunctional pyr operon transcriptional regulator/uracil phosphoribosyltransferase PyrR [Candidatus Neomarinimicrobiota bacterium]MBT3828579.1 bifunctional pyr operon transcriptional regulator/uracil phosphoribosyltransferase PyrR [Candidatus Neomarinimicrobiota bacterium]MBT3997016.1 bifunctional pyr operon transcriptional regulator/uracil phosphoribo
MIKPKEKLLFDETDIQKMITRLSHEILESNSNKDDLVLIGIQTRGEPLSKRVHAIIQTNVSLDIPLGEVNIAFHRDDFRERLVVPQVKGSNIPVTLDGKTVVLVDDVLFTGRTIRAAMDELFAYGRPAKIQLCVLVDRGHREIPIRGDFVGKNIPTNEGEHVSVLLKEVDEKDGIYLLSFKEDPDA